MMNEIIEMAGIALAGGFGALALKKYAPETSVLLVTAAGMMIFVTVVSKISPIAEQMNDLMQQSGTGTEYVPILLKTIGICLLCQFVSDTCREAGQASLAAKVELASKVTVIVTALPLFRNILDTAMGLMK